ncbi:MAG: hypothetical protein JRJ68_10615 [Deltaproteobacteria bacterium]|nr:hypothetical protein [Deltaproteobacteria bacterium]
MKIKKCSLQKAQQLISENIQQLQGETIDIKDGLHRVTSSVVAALLPRPSFDESVRDGYVIPLPGGPVQGDSSRTYRIVDEIPAGRPSSIVLEPATACRIMTGGCVPEGGVRVIPHENCVERNGELTVAEHLLQSAGTFIRKAGSETEKGDKIVAAGVVLQPMHLARLSASGVGSVMVSRTPSVAYFCTGSELKSSVDGLARGEKVSSNSFLLQGLLTFFGCCSRDLGIVDDNTRSLHHFFAEVKKQKFDMIISTGGM